jgi:hypothetical protein
VGRTPDALMSLPEHGGPALGRAATLRSARSRYPPAVVVVAVLLTPSLPTSPPR